METNKLLVGDMIHVDSSATDNPSLCLAAIVGGIIAERVEDHVWLVVMSFNGARISWLSDETWHYKDDCDGKRTSRFNGFTILP